MTTLFDRILALESAIDTFEDDVRARREGTEAIEIGRVLEVEGGAALAAIPGVVADLVAEGIVARGLDPDHVGAVIGHHHGHVRSRQEGGQVQDFQTVEFHADSFLESSASLCSPIFGARERPLSRCRCHNLSNRVCVKESSPASNDDFL